MRQKSDEELVQEVQRGNLVAFEILVKRYEKRLVIYAYRWVGDEDAAKDVVQETFFGLYKTIERVDTSRKFSAYLYKIAKNAAISFLRQKKVTVPLEKVGDVGSGGEEVYEDWEKKERKREVGKRLADLAAKYSRVLRLYYFSELSYKEISKKLRVPINTVRTRLKRGKEALKKSFGHGKS